MLFWGFVIGFMVGYMVCFRYNDKIDGAVQWIKDKYASLRG